MAFPRPIKFTSRKQRFVSGIGDPWDPWDPVCSPGAWYGTAQLEKVEQKRNFFQTPQTAATVKRVQVDCMHRFD